MNFREYLAQLPTRGKLSEVKLKILTRLWGENTIPFPKPWVSSTELLGLTGQKYFDRRARELREKLGCDLESSYREDLKDYAWRLRSTTLATPQSREYLTNQQKLKLFQENRFTCAVCGQTLLPGLRGLQADHKRPLSRGGKNLIGNWQPLCIRCNVGKRRACQGCDLPCEECSWAFPEIVGVSVLLSIKSDTLTRVDRYSTRVNKTRDMVMEEAAEYYLDTHEQTD